jgi:outer membrane protein OmpA-like peptidoglycan-associated protein
MNFIKIIMLSLGVILLVSLLGSCKTNRPRGYELQTEVWEEDFREDSTTKVYITGTKPIDSVDVNKLIFDIFRIETDEYPSNLKVYARVFDSLGHFVTNMANPYKKDTNVYFTSVTEWLGKSYKRKINPIDIFDVREFGANDSIPYNIVMTVDYSGSMEAVKEVIFDATETFVSLKMPYDNIALTTFNRGYDIKVPLINNKDQILTIYRSKRDQGFGLFSAVYEAMANSIDILERTSNDVPRVMVVFSDGDDNYSREDLDSLYKRAKKEKVHVFAVAFGYSKDENLRYMAQQTGGKFYKARSRQELIDVFRDIYMSLRYFYLITYKPPEYWGFHEVFANLTIPGLTDNLVARGEYNTADELVPPWLAAKFGGSVNGDNLADRSGLGDNDGNNKNKNNENDGSGDSGDGKNKNGNNGDDGKNKNGANSGLDNDLNNKNKNNGDDGKNKNSANSGLDNNLNNKNGNNGDNNSGNDNDNNRNKNNNGNNDLFGDLYNNDGRNGKKIAFTRPILFDFDSAVVKKESYPIIDEIVDIMIVMPNLKLEIQGHTDNVGTIEYNQKLSEDRARNVMAEIVKRGIESYRLRNRGFGFMQPVTSNDTPEGRALNRRTMFVVIAR